MSDPLKLQRFVRRTGLNGTFEISAVYESGAEAVVATFSTEHPGQVAYAAFMYGLGLGNRYTLFDRDIGQWIVGSVDKLRGPVSTEESA